MVARIHYPPAIINAYMKDILDNEYEDLIIPQFIPAITPVDINALTESFPGGDGKFAIYDRMFRKLKNTVTLIHCEQILYYFYDFNPNDNPNTINVIEFAQQIQDRLGHLDDSAREINSWAFRNTDKWEEDSKPVFFHHFKVYQLQETRDIIDFGTARTYAGNKLIIEYDWHKG